MKNLTAKSLKDMTLSEISDLPPGVLAELQTEIETLDGELKEIKEKISLGLNLKYGAAAEAVRQAEGKDTGTVRFDDDGFVVVANLAKRPKWDQSKLIAALEAMPADTARHYAKVSYTVDERKFTAAPPDIQALLASARIVEVGKPTYKIKTREAA